MNKPGIDDQHTVIGIERLRCVRNFNLQPVSVTFSFFLWRSVQFFFQDSQIFEVFELAFEAMNQQYTAGKSKDRKLGDDWQNDRTASGATAQNLR